MGLNTGLSRVFGFTRDILIASFFGTSAFAQAFVVAFRIPNLMRDLVGEGAASAALVPVLTEYSSLKSREEFWHLSRVLLNIFFVALLILSLAGVLLAPVIVRAIAPGFIEEPAKLALTISLTRIIFPFILLIGLFAYGMSVLNSLREFTVPSLGPVLLNIAMIAGLLWLCPRMGIEGLAISVLAGGVLQLAFIGWALYRKGFRFKFDFAFSHPGAGRIGRLLVPRFFGSAVHQLSVIVDSIFSSFEWIVGIGAPAALWYSYRLFHLPLAIFGIALATVSLPKMSEEAARKDLAALKNTVGFSLRAVFFILVPAGVGLAVLGRPIIEILFQRGEFSYYSTFITEKALFFYSFGLFACGGIKILVNAFYSLGDTKTPVKAATVALFLNLLFNAILMWPLKIGGLALATSLAAFFNFLCLYLILRKRIGDIGTRLITKSFFRVLLSSAAMGIFARFMIGAFAGPGMGPAGRAAGLVGTIVASIAFYLVISIFTGAEEMKALLLWISKRRS